MVWNRYVQRVALVFACWTGITASSHAVEIMGEQIDITVDMTYASKYMWHGFDIFDDHGAFHPSVQFDYNGFYVGAWGAFADTSGFVDLDEVDLYGGYSRTFFEDEAYSLTVDFTYTYFTYIHLNNDIDAQEILLSLSFDQLIPLGPSYLVPGYEMAYDWAGVQSSDKVDNGFFHTFSLGYDIPVPALIPSQEEQAISLYSDLTYGDGAFETDSGFSYATLGVSTTFEWSGVYLTPALYYQFSFEDSVNDEDDFYAMISLGYTF